MTLKDSSVYTGQGDIKTKVANGFGVYTSSDKSITYMGQWVAGVPSGWGVMIRGGDGETSAYRGMFAEGVPAGQGTGWNWDNNKALKIEFTGTAV
jgi:hypothetical protein